MDADVASPEGRHMESSGERKVGSDCSMKSWCIGRVRVKGCDVLWLRLALPTPVPEYMDRKGTSMPLRSPPDTPASQPSSGMRWICLTRDWLFFSRMPFKGRLFEAKVPVSALQVMCTSLTSTTQGRGLIIVAAKEWWLRAAPPPSSSDSTYGGASARASIARDVTVAARAFRSSGLRPTNAALVSGTGASRTAVLGCERRERRRCIRRANQHSEETRAFLIECGSIEERNWLLYCLQAATGTPPPLGFLRTCAALAETELLLQKLALFLESRGCLTLGSAVEPEFAGLALGICTSDSRCTRKSNCSNNCSTCSCRHSSSDERLSGTSAKCCSSPNPLGCLPCPSLAGVAAGAAAAAAAAGGFWLAGDISTSLLQQPHYAKQDLLLLLKGDVVGYPFSDEVRDQLRHRVHRLEMMHKAARDCEQQQQRPQPSAVVVVPSDQDGRESSLSGMPVTLFASFGEVLLVTLHQTLKGTWETAASRWRVLRASCCCDNNARCGSCCCCRCSSTGVQQQKLHNTKHGPMHMPHGVYRQYRRLLDLAGPLLDEMQLQQTRREELLRQHLLRCRICCCSDTSSSNSDTSSHSSSSSESSLCDRCCESFSNWGTGTSCSTSSISCSSCSSRSSTSSSSSSSSTRQDDSPQARLKMMPRSVHPFFSQLMRAPYACLLLQQQLLLWAEEIAKPPRSPAGTTGGGGETPFCKDGSGEADGWQKGQRDRQGNPLCGYPGLGRKRQLPIVKQPKVPRVGDECVICLEHFTAEAVITRYPGCSHSYHLSCLGTWIDWQNKGSPSATFLRNASPYSDQPAMLSSVAAVLIAEDEAALHPSPCWEHNCSNSHLQLQQQQHEAGAVCKYTSQRAPTPTDLAEQRKGAPSRRHCGCPSLSYPASRCLLPPYISLFTAATAADRVAEAAAAARCPRHGLFLGLPRAAERAAVAVLRLGDIEEPTCARRLAAFIGAAGPMREALEAEYNRAGFDGKEDSHDLPYPTPGGGDFLGKGFLAPASAGDSERFLQGAAAAGIQGCNTWAQLLAQLRDIEYWMATGATGPQLATALTLLEARGLPLSGSRAPGYFRPLRVFKDRCPMCQHTVTNFY